MHMDNGRYLTVIDLLLIEFFVRTGYAKVLIQQGWKPMSGGSIISYRRGLQPFQNYTVRYRFTGCDEIWNYMHLEFIADGKVCAAGYMKGAAVSKQGFVKMSSRMLCSVCPCSLKLCPKPCSIGRRVSAAWSKAPSIAHRSDRYQQAPMLSLKKPTLALFNFQSINFPESRKRYGPS